MIYNGSFRDANVFRRKSKVDDALVEILSTKGRKVKRDTRKRERRRIGEALHRKPVPTFSSSRSLFLPYGRFISALPSTRFGLPFLFRSRIPVLLSE